MIKANTVNDNYQPLVDKVASYFADSNVVLQDARNTIKEIEFNGQKLVVKSYVVPIAIRRFIYSYLKKSKAKRAYEYALKIADFTPKPIAYIENYQTLFGKSYFICEKFDTDFDIRAPLLDLDFPDRALVFKQFSKFVYELHQQQIVHQDLSPGNILIQKNHDGYRFNIIDINRMKFNNLSFKQRAKNFNKLWAHDNDLAIMLSEYAQLAQLDNDKFVSLGLKYNQQLKNRKTRKRKIKQILGLC